MSAIQTHPANLDYADYIRHHIRTVPDWPQTGVQFRDITPVLQNPKTFVFWWIFLCIAIWTLAQT